MFNYASLPWSFHRPSISSFDSLGLTYLRAEPGHNDYRWNTGDSTQIIAASGAGIYSVFVPSGDSGYISSERFCMFYGTDAILGNITFGA